MWRLIWSVLFLVILSISADTVIAQEGGPSLKVEKFFPVDTLKGWDYELVGGANGSQTSFDNWSQGGVNTISGTASAYFNAKYRKKRFGYLFTTNLKYGKSHIEERGTRKTSDQLNVSNRFSYRLKKRRFDLYGNIDFSSQFDRGYKFEDDKAVLISRFMAPAYINTGVGVSHKPAEFISVQGGFAVKQTIMRDTSLSTKYGLRPGEKYRIETGLAFKMDVEKKVMENIMLRSSLESFTNLQKSLRWTDIHFANELVGSINDYVNASLQFVMIYDRDFSTEVQIKQVLSAGLSVSIL